MKWITIFAMFAGGLSAAVSTGPEVGSKAPTFEARDQNGKDHTLASILGPKGAIVVFYRSADW